MRTAQVIRLSTWVLIILNILMAMGSIWAFNRMSPAISLIIERNEQSLKACEDMLSSLSISAVHPSERKAQTDNFQNALVRAENNITEKGESSAIELIGANYRSAFQGDRKAFDFTLEGIQKLGAINREAMEKEDLKARNEGSAGAWAIVFMGVIIFLYGMIYLRRFSSSLIHPLEEMQSVLAAANSGDRRRRCITADLPRDIRQVLSNLNRVLDNSNYSSPDFIERSSS